MIEAIKMTFPNGFEAYMNIEKHSDQPVPGQLLWFWDGLDSYLSRNQLKQTKQRKVVVNHFLRMDTHVDAEELYESVRGNGYNIGLATIYRTLNLLKDAGLVEQNSFADGRAVFEVSKPGDHHDHLVCTDCATVVEFENEEIEHLQKNVAREHGFVLTSHRLDLYGRCSSCYKMWLEK